MRLGEETESFVTTVVDYYNLNFRIRYKLSGDGESLGNSSNSNGQIGPNGGTHIQNLTFITVSDGNLDDLNVTLDSLRCQKTGFRQIVQMKKTEEDFTFEVSGIGWSVDFRSELDHGPFDAMNRALQLVETEFVMFLNAGDKINPNADLEFLTGILAGSDRRWLVGRADSYKYGHRVGSWPMPSLPRWTRLLGLQSWNHQSCIFEAEMLRSVTGGLRGSQITADWSTALVLEQAHVPIKLNYVICDFDASGISSRSQGFGWIADHVASYRQAGLGGPYISTFFLFTLGWFLKASNLWLVALRLNSLLNRGRERALKSSLRFARFFRFGNRTFLPRILLNTLRAILSRFARLRRLRSLTIRSLDAAGIYEPSRKLLDRLIQGRKVLVPMDKTFSTATRAGSIESEPVRVFVDDVIGQLAPDRGIERFWHSVLKQMSQNPLVELHVLSRSGRLDKYASVVHDFREFAESEIHLDAQAINKITAGHGTPQSWFLSTYYTMAKGLRNMTVVHDLIPEVLGWGEISPIWTQRKTAFEQSDKLLCLSRNTSQDLESYYPELVERSHFLPMGIDRSIFHRVPPDACRESLANLGIPQDYLVYVGSRALYKNGFELENLANDGGLPAPLVLVGGEPARESEHVIQVRPNNSELAIIYSHAKATLITSSYEGFGFPALESLACGTPVILPNNSSLQEASLGMGIYLQSSISGGIDAELAKAEEFKGSSDYWSLVESKLALRSWSKFSEELLSILRNPSRS